MSINSSGIIYYHDWDYLSLDSPAENPTPVSPSSGYPLQKTAGQSVSHRPNWTQLVGIGLVSLALGGLTGPLTPFIRMETAYRLMQTRSALTTILASQSQALRGYVGKLALFHTKISFPTKQNAAPVLFTPLTGSDGNIITPIDTNFGLVIPKIGINASIIPAVNPTNPGEYETALMKGVAHASTSYFPNENGTVYLFSHSTSYDWFVKDLNAVFYLVKNLETGDIIVLIYKGKEYTYKITDKKVVSPHAVSYLVPHAGTRQLILQTCWPPGSVAERLLIFADYIEGPTEAI